MKPAGKGMIASPSVNTLNRLDRSKVVLWRRPIQTIRYAYLELTDLTKDCLRGRQRSVLSMLLLIALLLLIYYIPGFHQPHLEVLLRNLYFCGKWILLGALSSVGFGTGLHTFLLYLGPFIANVALAAYECGTLDFPKPPYPDSIICPDVSQEIGMKVISLWSIMSKVRFESLLWGAGTALGELPPYFMAKFARLGGEEPDDEEYREFMAFIHGGGPPEPSIGDKFKIFMEKMVANLGFPGILLFASVPNPCFDLAGITCGHFLVPFWKFFGATLIGKALIKAHLQMIFVILAFSETHFEKLINALPLIPYIGKRIQAPLKSFLLDQKSKLHGGKQHTPSDNLLQQVMSLVVTGMFIWFGISILNSLAQNWHKKLCDARKKV